MGTRSESSNPSNRLEVLNISNINAQGLIVLNDERLLELIQQYPFIYNPRVHPYQDEDYNEWAWENISASFNRAYKQANLQISFTPKELQQRWQILQPIIKSLSKAYDVNAIPQSLRRIVSKISVQLEDSSTPPPKQLTEAQSVILSNIPKMINENPQKLKRLEAEMMELILNAELSAKSTLKLGPVEFEECEHEYRAVMNAMRLRELVRVSDNDDDDNDVEVENDSTILLKDGEENEIKTHLFAKCTNREEEINSIIDSKVISTESTNSCTTLSLKTVVIDDDSNSPPDSGGAEFVGGLNNRTINVRDALLEPLEEKKWIPLNQAGFHVRPCVVRLKRISLEDDLPLATIKRERKW